MEKQKIGEIRFNKGGWSSTSETFFPRYFRDVWFVDIPILESEKKKGPYTTGIGFENEWDAKRFSEFLKNHMKKYIRELRLKEMRKR